MAPPVPRSIQRQRGIGHDLTAPRFSARILALVPPTLTTVALLARNYLLDADLQLFEVRE